MSDHPMSRTLWLPVFSLLAGISFGQTVLFNFTGGPDGSQPMSGVILKNGFLYGATSGGGRDSGVRGCGVVFKMTKTGAETVLWTFQGSPNDGCGPEGELIMDLQGNLYGTTHAGGMAGEGTIFKVTPEGTETVLYHFVGGLFNVGGTIALDQTHNLLYGIAFQEQPDLSFLPSILRLDLSNLDANPSWYTFGVRPNGSQMGPAADLTVDGTGNLCGATVNGGTLGFGSVFEIPFGRTYKDIYSFQNQEDGVGPNSGVVLHKGNLYGFTGCGPTGTAAPVVYKMTKKGVLTLLYTFPIFSDQPFGELQFDTAGNIYGVAINGPDPGSVYELIPAGLPPYTYVRLHTFGSSADGSFPWGQRLAIDGKDDVYGTTTDGGTNSFGTVFRITPPTLLTSLPPR